jgi:hypothetical protein
VFSTLKVLNFRRNSGDGNRVGNFDAEIVPGLIIKDMALMQRPGDDCRVFGKRVYVTGHIANELAALALAASVTTGGAHDGQ